MRLSLLLATMVLAVLSASGSSQADEADRLFTLKVLPLFKAKCFGCHADGDDLKGEFDIRNRISVLKGGESGDAAIVPGKPNEGTLYAAIRWDGLEMPPKENDRLTKEEIKHVHDWIMAGAPWPSDDVQLSIRKAEWSVLENEDGVIIPNSGGLSDEWTYRRYDPKEVWAFQPVAKPTPPHSDFDTQSDRHPVDAFIDRELQQAKLEPAPAAKPRTLIRRATYGLTGLPPTQSEVQTFVDAYERDPAKAWADLVDRLLESEHYGERWAQHWLDVVRYADTSGFSNDYEKSNAWRYRDYVIRAFNNDKPYDDFILEQLAGDEWKPGDSEATIATGFLRMGPFGTAMIPQEEIRQIYRDDLVHNVGQTFLSMPLRCCKCHDHKFDPIPTRDYYRLYAAFSATQPAEVHAEFLDAENRNGFTEKKKLVQQLLDYAKGKRDALIAKREEAAKQWYQEHDLTYKDEQTRRNDPEDQKPPRHCGLTPEEKGRLKVREQDCWIWERRLERFAPMAQSVYNGPDTNLNARKMRPGGGKKKPKKWSPESHILMGGSLDSKGEAVTPGVLSCTQVAPVSPSDQPYTVTNDISGRRLALAKWIADPKNPLTARSFVNRVWHYHFGKGLVATPNNFGAKGSKPTHPELLDWLTTDFVENGWKLKRLHRQIMLTDVYRRSSTHPSPEKLDAEDPDNKLLARFTPRRMTAEEFRDSVLAATGELNLEVGGLPIKPEINREVALQPRMIQFSIAPAHQPSRTPEERNRRTIYAYRVRGQADPMLELLNQPNPNESCEIRTSSAVSPQALTLMNSETMTDRSIALAMRIQRETKQTTNETLVRQAIRLAYSREATESEVAALSKYLEEMKAYHADEEPAAIKNPKYVTRSLVEEFTGEPFTFAEWLNVYEDYIPDPKPWTVDDDVRALADVCLLLFNSNEFVYVY